MARRSSGSKLERKFSKSAWLICPEAGECPSKGCPHKKRHREKKECSIPVHLCSPCVITSKRSSSEDPKV